MNAAAGGKTTKGKATKAAKPAKPAKKAKTTKGKAGAKKDDAGQTADGIKKERDEDSEREKDEVGTHHPNVCFAALAHLWFGIVALSHQENGTKDIDEAYLTLWERLRLDMIRSKNAGALSCCQSMTKRPGASMLTV
jgi:hypothetical protein